MKNLKKVLSLVLVIAMAFSLVTIASAAKVSDYADAADITQKNAVDLLSQAGVLAGMGGSFMPKDNFTREQAAKVIAYLMLGAKAADGLKTQTSSFSDVAPTRWSAPYIEYCVTKGVINGLGDGTFNPEGKVTGTQFAKMLLTALGYGKNGEYVGPNWEIATITDAVDNEIFSLDVDYTAPATREQIAQYAYNALLLDAVTWDKNKGEYTASTNPNAADFFATKLGLSRDLNKTTENGITGYNWYLDNVKIAFYPSETVLGFKANGGGLYNYTDKYGVFAFLYYVAQLEQSYDIYLNGSTVTTTWSGKAAASPSGATVIPVNTKFVYNGDVYVATADILDSDVYYYGFPKAKALGTIPGVVYTFVSTDRDEKAEKVVITEKSVARAAAAPSVANGFVSIDGVLSQAVNVDQIVYDSDIKAKDYVLYYKDGMGITHVEKADSVTGTVTQKTRTNTAFGDAYQLTVAGTPRAASGLNGATFANDASFSSFATTDYGVEGTFWLDDGGNIIAYELSDVVLTSNFVVLLGAAQSGYDLTAKVLFTDGTVKTVQVALFNDTNVDGTDYATVDAGKDHFYSYSVDANGQYSLTLAPVANRVAVTGNIVQKAGFATGVVGDANTVFLGDDDAGATIGKFSVTTGVAKAPEYVGVTVGEALVVKGVARFVYIGAAASAPAANQDIIYVVNPNTNNYYPQVGTTPAYYEIDTVVDGAIVKTKVATSYISSLTAGLNSVRYNQYGYVSGAGTAIPASDYAVATGVVAPANGTILVGSNAFTYDKDTEVFVVNFGILSKSSIDSIIPDANDTITVLVDQDTDDTLDYIVITRNP